MIRRFVGRASGCRSADRPCDDFIPHGGRLPRLTVSRISEIICGMEYKLIGETSWQTREFVENIVKIMERKGMTRLEFARRLGGVRPSYVTKILSGRENMTAKTMEAMAAAVGYELVFGLRRRPRGKGDGLSAREIKHRIDKRKGDRHGAPSKAWLNS